MHEVEYICSMLPIYQFSSIHQCLCYSFFYLVVVLEDCGSMNLHKQADQSRRALVYSNWISLTIFFPEHREEFLSCSVTH